MTLIVRYDGHFKWVRQKGGKKEYPYPPGNKALQEKAFQAARDLPDGNQLLFQPSFIDRLPDPEISGTGEVRDKDGNVRFTFKLGI